MAKKRLAITGDQHSNLHLRMEEFDSQVEGGSIEYSLAMDILQAANDGRFRRDFYQLFLSKNLVELPQLALTLNMLVAGGIPLVLPDRIRIVGSLKLECGFDDSEMLGWFFEGFPPQTAFGPDGNMSHGVRVSLDNTHTLPYKQHKIIKRPDEVKYSDDEVIGYLKVLAEKVERMSYWAFVTADGFAFAKKGKF